MKLAKHSSIQTTNPLETLGSPVATLSDLQIDKVLAVCYLHLDKKLLPTWRYDLTIPHRSQLALVSQTSLAKAIAAECHTDRVHASLMKKFPDITDWILFLNTRIILEDSDPSFTIQYRQQALKIVVSTLRNFADTVHSRHLNRWHRVHIVPALGIAGQEW